METLRTASTEILALAFVVSLIISMFVGFCWFVWKRPIPVEEWDLEPMGEASSYRRDRK